MKNIKQKHVYASILVLVIIITSIFSNNVFAAKPARTDRNPPTAPTNLQVMEMYETSLVIMWDASWDKVGVESYDVYMNDRVIGNTTETTYSINNLNPGDTYNIYVKAIDLAGHKSTLSETLTITLPAVETGETPTSTPTVTPTIAPTSTPTVEPTIAPTTAPTNTPTVPPTSTPTVAPTSTPTVTPTSTPTVAPTSTPTPTVAPTSGKKVVGYYAAWAAYSGYTPDMIDASKLTYIHYAFANISSDLTITMGYPDKDPGNFSKLNALKQSYPHIKTIISVGGWSWSGRFSDAALTDASRTTFANSVVDFIVQYGFDGVDIDWEYPVSGGLTTNVKRPEDKYNFTLLMKTLREKLDARGAIDGKEYLLTFAGATSTGYVNNIELTKLTQYVDYAMIMTYDIHGTWDKYTDFNAPLYINNDASLQFKFSVDSGISVWLNNGFPKDKLIMGVPFYGYLYSSVVNYNHGLYQTYGGSSSIGYGDIVNNYLNKTGYTRYFHSESMVPWLYNGTIFISYDDEESIALKAKYINSKDLGGAMIWELSQDPSGVLLDALYQNLD